MTEYVVVALPGPGPSNTASGPKPLATTTVKASGAKAAIREVAEKNGSGTYVAVPSSSWKPETVTVAQTTKVSFGGST